MKIVISMHDIEWKDNAKTNFLFVDQNNRMRKCNICISKQNKELEKCLAKLLCFIFKFLHKTFKLWILKMKESANFCLTIRQRLAAFPAHIGRISPWWNSKLYIYFCPCWNWCGGGGWCFMKKSWTLLCY